MRTLVHLSDLHFGRVDQALLAPLTALVTQIEPDLVVVSGDLTQRARSHEFLAARAFLDALPGPQIVVPGNHDIPLYDLVRRMVAPLVKYRKYIGHDLEPEFEDEEMVVLGINTARSLTVKDGRINPGQVAAMRSRFGAVDRARTRIVVSHHPFDLPEHLGQGDLVRRAPLAMAAFAHCGVDLLLAGHLHASHAGHGAAGYKMGAALLVQAGTATSTRARGETNSFNVVRVEAGRISVERYGWHGANAAFAPVGSATFLRVNDVWTGS